MQYDIIIAGAGLGGLSFLKHLFRSGLSASVLLIDAEKKTANDRTWSLWARDKPIYDCAEGMVWDQLGFATDGQEIYEDIAPYRYYSITGLDFYREVFSEIRRHENVTVLRARVEDIRDLGSEAEVHTDRGTFRSRFVIDSVTRPFIDPEEHLLNFQNFIGWTIETESPVFDPRKPMLMDFRVPQHGAASFMYLLPFSSRKALVEFTQFTPRAEIDDAVYTGEIRAYLKKFYALTDFRIVEREQGTIPMTNFPFDKRPSSRVFRIGTAGGDTKSTTGYTFQNVQAHCREIIAELQGNPLRPEANPAPLRNPARFSFYDTLLLRIIAEKPEQVKPIMSLLFKTQPMQRVLRFLDEETNLLEETMIFARLPWQPFLNTIFTARSHAARS
jgi:lycopene beta-cyclase